MLPRRNRFIDNNDNKWEAFDIGGHYVYIAFSIFINAAINLSLRLPYPSYLPLESFLCPISSNLFFSRHYRHSTDEERRRGPFAPLHSVDKRRHIADGPAPGGPGHALLLAEEERHGWFGNEACQQGPGGGGPHLAQDGALVEIVKQRRNGLAGRDTLELCSIRSVSMCIRKSTGKKF